MLSRSTPYSLSQLDASYASNRFTNCLLVSWCWASLSRKMLARYIDDRARVCGECSNGASVRCLKGYQRLKELIVDTYASAKTFQQLLEYDLDTGRLSKDARKHYYHPHLSNLHSLMSMSKGLCSLKEKEMHSSSSLSIGSNRFFSVSKSWKM